ncbi:MAG: BlaI/MecI/CopY family transcriptional regulator [Lachnospiraceae bacterium]|nr:BlaI/MecI/CopY family transcriptional regulator [Lachnospiraceae bacterium]
MEKIFESEYRFLCILWEREPVTSPELVKLCNEILGWKKSTTYTVIKKLAEKGIVKSENTIVSSLIKKEEVDKQEGEELLQRTSNGNVPAFLASFLKDRKISKEEAERLRRLIDEMEESV